MQYWAGLLAGIAGSAGFWLIDKFLFTLPQSFQIGGALACFIVFGATGFYLASRKRASPEKGTGTRIASGVRGKRVKITVDGVKASGATEVLTNVKAKDDLNANIKNVETKPQ